MKHLVGSVIRVLIDYMDYIPLCTKLKSALEVQREWPEIRQILGKKKKKSFAYEFFSLKNVRKQRLLMSSLRLFRCNFTFRIIWVFKSSLILPLI